MAANSKIQSRRYSDTVLGLGNRRRGSRNEGVDFKYEVFWQAWLYG